MLQVSPLGRRGEEYPQAGILHRHGRGQDRLILLPLIRDDLDFGRDEDLALHVGFQVDQFRADLASGSPGPDGEAVFLAPLDSHPEETVVLQARVLVGMPGRIQVDIVRIAVERAVILQGYLSEGGPAGEGMREVEGTVLDHLGIHAAVRREVDVLEEHPVHGRLDGGAILGGVEYHRVGGLLRRVFQAHDRPFIFPPDFTDDEFGLAAIPFIGMAEIQVLSVDGIGRTVTGSDETVAVEGHEAAAALGHVFPGVVQIGTFHVPGTADRHLIGTVHAHAAVVPGDKEVVPAAVLVHVRALDGILSGQGGKRIVDIGPVDGVSPGDGPGYAVHARQVFLHADELDAVPVGAEDHPGRPVIGNDDIGVDGVPFHPVRDGMDDFTAVLPGFR